MFLDHKRLVLATQNRETEMSHKIQYFNTTRTVISTRLLQPKCL